MIEPFLDQATVRRLLRYSRKSGRFVWRRRPDARREWNTRYAGKDAGCRWSPNGKVFYRSIRIFDWPFLAHRIAWLYVVGSWPVGVDHEDGDGENNRWRNLREATAVQNGANRGCNSNNTSGFKGVSVGSSGRYRATIQFDGKWRQIGTFDSPEEASAAYQREARRLAGEFARAP